VVVTCAGATLPACEARAVDGLPRFWAAAGAEVRGRPPFLPSRRARTITLRISVACDDSR